MGSSYNFKLRYKLKPSSALGYLITANFRTLRVFPLQVLASSCLPQQILKFPSNLFTHFDEPKNSLELPNLTRSIRKCSNKLMTNTSGEINSQSKQDITVCHVAKVKSATSAYYLAHAIPFLAYVIFPLNPTL